LESGKSYRFPFLSSYERFIVHSAISQNDTFIGLVTQSEGMGRDRRLVISPASDSVAADSTQSSIEEPQSVEESPEE
jgi:hypothetical protein